MDTPYHSDDTRPKNHENVGMVDTHLRLCAIPDCFGLQFGYFELLHIPANSKVFLFDVAESLYLSPSLFLLEAKLENKNIRYMNKKPNNSDDSTGGLFVYCFILQ